MEVRTESRRAGQRIGFENEHGCERILEAREIGCARRRVGFSSGCFVSIYKWSSVLDVGGGDKPRPGQEAERIKGEPHLDRSRADFPNSFSRSTPPPRPQADPYAPDILRFLSFASITPIPAMAPKKAAATGTKKSAAAAPAHSSYQGMSSPALDRDAVLQRRIPTLPASCRAEADDSSLQT